MTEPLPGMPTPAPDLAAERRIARALRTITERRAAQTQYDLENPPPPDIYGDFTLFFEEYLSPNFARKPGMIQWCVDWMNHDEAVMVVTALHQSWEQFNRDADIAGWLVLRAYPLLQQLWGAGCFTGCDRVDPTGVPYHAPTVVPLP